MSHVITTKTIKKASSKTVVSVWNGYKLRSKPGPHTWPLADSVHCKDSSTYSTLLNSSLFKKTVAKSF